MSEEYFPILLTKGSCPKATETASTIQGIQDEREQRLVADLYAQTFYDLYCFRDVGSRSFVVNPIVKTRNTYRHLCP